MTNVMLCDPNCEHMSPKEAEQSPKKEPHVCKLYNKILRHESFHPKLMRVEQCILDGEC